MNTNYIEELNESQCAAVTYNDGPSLATAGQVRDLQKAVSDQQQRQNYISPTQLSFK